MTYSTVLITGCSEGGIGFSLCEEFAHRGCKVYATARSLEKMKGFTSPNIVPLVMDVTDDQSVKTVVDTIISKEGRIDFLVNNAGMASFGPVLEVPLEQVKAVFETNVMSVLRVTRTVIFHMATRKSGTIINIGSVVGEIHTPWSGIYSSSKAAMMAISNVLEMECRAFNVKVLTVSPGGIRSEIAQNASTKYGGLPKDSPWINYEGNVVTRMWLSQASGSLPTKEFARRVVSKALHKPPLYMTLGSNSTIMWILQFLPRSFVHNYLWKRFGTLKKST